MPSVRTARLAALLALLALLLLPASAGAAGPHRDERPAPPPGGPWLGAALDWSTDSPAGYRERLGRSAAVYGYDAPVPLGDDDLSALTRAVGEAEAEGASLVVTLLPDVAVTDLDGRAVEEIVDDLEAAGLGADRPAWVRPFPELNAPWRAWGQRPAESVAVFRDLADEVHRRLPGVGVVWQPVYGAGYPFGERALSTRRDAGPTDDARLDTDGDGRLTLRDDPYGPYWPGPDAVDWVGLGLFHWGESYPFVTNVRPPAGKLLDQLAGRYGYPDAAQTRLRDFYARFAEGPGKPFLLDTAALWSRATTGPSESAVKEAWFRQVADQRVRESHPLLGLVLWQELRRTETEARGKVVDWRATRTPALATAFDDLLVDPAGLTTPSAESVEEDEPDAVADEREGTVLSGTVAIVTSSATSLVALGVLVGLTVHRRRRWTYDGALDTEPGPRRDLRIDLLRGVAICFVVIDHVDVPSLWQLLSQEALGPVSGAELFVLLSGVVLGTVYGPKVVGLPQWYDAATRLWRRALTLWLTALVVIVLVYLVALLPVVDARVLTTFADQGTGGAGAGARGRVYDLYAGFDTLFDYPIPGWALRDVLLLRLGPSQINIIGLYVVLLLVAPLAALALLRRRVLPLLAVSLAAYALYQVEPVRVLPSQFEDPFPLLAWQVLFVIGLAAGWHRQALVDAARRPAGRAVVVMLALVTLAFALFAWSSPFLSNTADVRLDLVATDTFSRVYDEWFARTSLGPGRVVATLALTVTLYALLTRFWTPVARAAGWFLLPLGRATLYVFVVHVVFVVAVANLPRIDSVWVGTLTHAVVLAALWVMVRTRFLFKVVPS